MKKLYRSKIIIMLLFVLLVFETVIRLVLKGSPLSLYILPIIAGILFARFLLKKSGEKESLILNWLTLIVVGTSFSGLISALLGNLIQLLYLPYGEGAIIGSYLAFYSFLILFIVGFGITLSTLIIYILRELKNKNLKVNLIQALFFILISVLPTQAQIRYEKADLIFRELQTWETVPFAEYAGHTGIYWKWVTGDPNDMSQHLIVEALGETGVWVTTLKNFMETAPFLGGGTINPTYSQREDITNLSILQNGKPYAFFTGYKGPNTFRCDGLAEYCYEAVGLDIVPDTGWMTLWPKLQLSYMNYAQGEPPALQILDSQHTSIPNGGVTSDNKISVHASDGERGSGLSLLEIWQGDPDVGGSLLKSFPQNYSIENTYSSSEIGALPEGQIYVRSFDQAGNTAVHQFPSPSC